MTAIFLDVKKTIHKHIITLPCYSKTLFMLFNKCITRLVLKLKNLVITTQSNKSFKRESSLINKQISCNKGFR